MADEEQNETTEDAVEETVDEPVAEERRGAGGRGGDA